MAVGEQQFLYPALSFANLPGRQYRQFLSGGLLMPLLVGGAIAVVLGLIGLVVWWQAFAVIIKGALPIMMLLGGGLAIYVGYDDIQEKLREERKRQDDKLEKAQEEIEQIRARAELYREELEKLRTETLKTKENNP